VDLILAAKYFKLASAQNRVLAQINYGACLFHRPRVPTDLALTANYFQLSADQNHPDGQYHYGCFKRVILNRYDRLNESDNLNSLPEFLKSKPIESDFQLGCPKSFARRWTNLVPKSYWSLTNLL
jgi:TPR repeat protein